MSDFNPNSPDAMFAAILLRIQELKDGQESIRGDFQLANATVHRRVDDCATEISKLKTAEEVRKREVKWAVAGIAVIGWVINALISLKSHS